MQILVAIIVLVIGYFFLTAVGGLFLAAVGFFIDHLLIAFLGLGVILFIFGKK
ncbi:MAG: hypothetical protein RSE32_15320 [Comamonas sp.]|uniref:hypothetical protein n=1 Tax=Comamonas sp. TaxID=34028 RepID=UPI002FCC3FDA